MGPLALISLIFGALILTPMMAANESDTADESGDDNDPVDPVEPIDPVDPATLGASFTGSDTGVDIQLNENETGRLAVITYVDTQDSADDFLAIHEARYYLVPEGVEWPDNTSETAGQIPGEDEFGGFASNYLLNDFEEYFDLTLLGTYDLLAAGNDSPTNSNMADSLPELTTNGDVDYYYLESNTDGDDLITFLQEGYLETRNGVERTNVTENSVGTDEIDWLSTDVAGVTLDGAGGDDTLQADAADVVLIGGDGNDGITATRGGADVFGGEGDDGIFVSNGTVDAGAGDDRVGVLASDVTLGDGNDFLDMTGGTGFGEDGNDSLNSYSGEAVTFYGGEGDDRFSAIRAGSAPVDAELYGGAGNDRFGVGNSAQAFGGDGNDFFQTDAGGIVDAGAGDDNIRVWDFYDNDAGRALVSGGDGADVFDIKIRNAFGNADDPADDVFTEIADFDADEDMLMIGRINSGPEVDRIVVTENAETRVTDIEVFFEPGGSSPDAVSTIVRLTGVTGLDPSTIVIT